MKKYQTQSLYEASFLLCKNFPIVSKDTNGQKTTLAFQDSPELRQSVFDFYNGVGAASAKSLFDFYRSLKDMVFQR